MSLDYICKSYGVPASVGRRIRYTGEAKPTEGTVTGARGAHLEVLMDGDKKPGLYHPTWEMAYLAEVRKVRSRPSRYAEYLHAESSLTFSEWLGINSPEYVYDRNGLVMMQRFDHLGGTVRGSYCETKKAAKASYKEALARHRAFIAQTRFESGL